ncbi:MAG TPA: glutamate racemase [Syntrophales bacterium]|nr:glutamate racemase [Syntrophales bacterium]HOL58309.1 glutamate racemase [Syntrophales bacterium]HPO34478.1 glutamate racemase [Syntrophales bacterium]
MEKRNAIGVFDSGVGGLTVVRALMERLPHESIYYFGDTARVPYGIKSRETINAYAREITEFLLRHEVKLLIIACNTTSSVAYETVQHMSPVPVLEVIEAGARQAVKESKKGTIGVIGTLTTINSNAYARKINEYAPSARVVSQACPLFVPLVEEGWLDHPVTLMTAQEYLRPILIEGVDTLVLGCTHYPLLKPLLREVVGPEVTLVDSAVAIAQRAAELLLSEGLANDVNAPVEYKYFVTDVPLRFHTIAERFLGRELGPVELVKLPL